MANVPVIDPNGIPGNMPEESLDAALKAGYQKAVSVISPQGKPGKIPASKLQDALQAGFTQSVIAPPAPPSRDYNATGQEPPSPYQPSPRSNLEAVEGTEPAPTAPVYQPGIALKPGAGTKPQEEIGEGPGITWQEAVSPILTGIESAENVATLGGARWVAQKAGELVGDPGYAARAKQRQLENPGLALTGEMAGLYGPNLPVAGGEALAKGVARLLPVARETSPLGIIVKNALAAGAGSAAEGSLYATGKLIDESALGDPNITADRMIASIGGTGLLTGLLGGGSVFASELFPSAYRMMTRNAERVSQPYPTLADKLKSWGGAQDIASLGATEEAKTLAAGKSIVINPKYLKIKNDVMPPELLNSTMANLGEQFTKPMAELNGESLLPFDWRVAPPDMLARQGKQLQSVLQKRRSDVIKHVDDLTFSNPNFNQELDYLPNLAEAFSTYESGYVKKLDESEVSSGTAKMLRDFIGFQKERLKADVLAGPDAALATQRSDDLARLAAKKEGLNPENPLYEGTVARAKKQFMDNWVEARAPYASYRSANDVMDDIDKKIDAVTESDDPYKNFAIAALYRLKRQITGDIGHGISRIDDVMREHPELVPGKSKAAPEGYPQELVPVWLDTFDKSRLADQALLLGKTGVQSAKPPLVSQMTADVLAGLTVSNFALGRGAGLKEAIAEGVGGAALTAGAQWAKPRSRQLAAKALIGIGTAHEKALHSEAAQHLAEGMEAARQFLSTPVKDIAINREIEKEQGFADGGEIPRLDDRRTRTMENGQTVDLIPYKGIPIRDDDPVFRKWTNHLPDYSGLPKGLKRGEIPQPERGPVKIDTRQRNDLTDQGNSGYIRMAEGGEVPGQGFIPPPMMEKMNVLAALERNNAKVTNHIKSAASTLVRSGVKAGYKSRGEVLPGLRKNLGTSDLAEHQQHADALRSLQNPEVMASQLANITTDLEQHAPLTAMATRTATTRAVNFLNSKLPQAPGKTPLGADWHPSASELATYNKYKNAVDDPVSLLKMAAAGTITPHAVEAVQTVYPALFDSMKTAITDKLSETKRPSYQARQAIGNLFGMDMDGSHANVMTLQQTYQSPSAKSADSQAMPAKNTAQMAKVDLGARAEPLSAQRDEA